MLRVHLVLHGFCLSRSRLASYLRTPAHRSPALPTTGWLEGQDREAASLTYSEVLDKAPQGGNWRKLLEQFQGEQAAGAGVGAGAGWKPA